MYMQLQAVQAESEQQLLNYLEKMVMKSSILIERTEISVQTLQLSKADRQPSMGSTKDVLKVLTESYAMPVFREAAATMSL